MTVQVVIAYGGFLPPGNAPLVPHYVTFALFLSDLQRPVVGVRCVPQECAGQGEGGVLRRARSVPARVGGGSRRHAGAAQDGQGAAQEGPGQREAPGRSAQAGEDCGRWAGRSERWAPTLLWIPRQLKAKEVSSLSLRYSL